MKKHVYICITESLCFTAGINIINQLYFNKINLKNKTIATKLKKKKRKRITEDEKER